MLKRPILVLGATGQVARALARCGSVRDHPMILRGRQDGDITDPLRLLAVMAELRPVAVINAAGFTAVDRAETERKAAFAINAEGPEHVARLCRYHDIPLVHLSTDYVFDGTSCKPYRETDTIGPLSVYGASKAAGEAAIRNTWPRHLILRTAWVYSLDGTNFLKTMLRLAGERDELSIVDDQRGTPTSAEDLATAITGLVSGFLANSGPTPWGTYHLTNLGETTWFGFASAIFDLTGTVGRKAPALRPITTVDYPTLACRPAYSVLDNSKIEQAFGLTLPEWRTSLAACLANMGKEKSRENVSR